MINTEYENIALVLLACWVVIIAIDALVATLLCRRNSQRRWRNCFAWGLLACLLPAGFMVYGIFERNTYVINEVEVPISGLPASFEGYRVVHISDIHAHSYLGRVGQLERLVNVVNGFHPDMIAFTGDMITFNDEEITSVSPALQRFESRDGVFSVLGNHDYGTHKSGRRSRVIDTAILSRVDVAERAMGWKLLRNEHAFIVRGDDSIAVVGVENTTTTSYFPSKGDLPLAMQGIEGEACILLSHSSCHWRNEVMRYPVALTLSGHTHAGQFSLFGLTVSRFMYTEDAGLYREGEHYLYVNAGWGETFLPARIGARHEITVLTLRSR